MVSNVTNVQNISPTAYFENNVQNLYQTTHNLHQNSLNFINNTSVRMLNMLGLGTSEPPAELQHVLHGGLLLPSHQVRGHASPSKTELHVPPSKTEV